MNIINQPIEKNLNRKCNNMENLIGTNKEQLKLFYENQMNYQYKKDEKSIKDIIK